MAEVNYIILATSDSSIVKRFKAVKRRELLAKGSKMRRTLAGVDFVMGKTYKIISMTLRVPAEVTDANYGTRADIEALYAKNEALTFTDHDGTQHSAVIINDSGIDPLVTVLTGPSAYFMIGITLVLLN